MYDGQSIYYFRNLYRLTLDDVRGVLETLALGRQPSEIVAHARRWLQRCCLITPDGQPRISVFQDWARKETG